MIGGDVMHPLPFVDSHEETSLIWHAINLCDPYVAAPSSECTNVISSGNTEKNDCQWRGDKAYSRALYYT